MRALSLLLLWVACSPNTDLTVPWPKTKPKFEAEVPPAADDGRLPAWQAPLHYRLALDLDPRGDSFTGSVSIDVRLDKPTAAFVLHAADLRIERAEVVAGERHPLSPSLRPAAGPGQDAEELVLIAPRELPVGTVTLNIDYQGAPSEGLSGLFRVREGDAAYLFTQFEPADARHMLPCFDDPIHKVPFDVRVTAPKDDAVFANAPLEAQKPVEGGAKTEHVFATSERMPTYLLALAVGPLEARDGARAPVPIRAIAPRGKSDRTVLALQVAAEQLAILSDYFGSPYPYAKLDLVAVPNFGAGAMENAGLITFSEEYLVMDASAPASAQRDMALVMAHEIAHHWFGNLVTMKWWDDLWLNEGFATYAETLVVDRWRPEMRPELELLHWIGWVMDVDALASARAVRQPVSNIHQAEEAFDPITYVKGAAVIRMLHRWIGDEAFRAGLRSYMAEHAWGNAGAEDLFRALSHSSGKRVGDVASSFLDQPGVPLVKATLHCERKQAPRVELEQQRYRGVSGAPPDASLWRIPVCVAWPRGGQLDKSCAVLEERRAELELSTTACPAWILPNAGYDGYYRYRLDAKAMAALAKATRGQGTGEKIGLLSNLWALVQADAASPDMLLDVLYEQRREREREVLEAAIAVLTKMNDALVEPQSRQHFQRLVSAVLLPTAKRLGFDRQPKESDDDRLLRRSVLMALSELGDDPWLVAEGNKRAAQWLADPATVDDAAAEIALRVAARSGAIRYGDLAPKLALDDANQRLMVVSAMGSFADQGELERALMALDRGEIRAHDVHHLLRAAEAWPDNRAAVVAWSQAHLATFTKQLPGFGVARLLRPIRRLCDQRLRDDAARALAAPVAELAGSDRQLREALDAADLCIDLRRRRARATGESLRKRRF